jgi:hypothetical protein
LLTIYLLLHFRLIKNKWAFAANDVNQKSDGMVKVILQRQYVVLIFFEKQNQ